MLTRSEPRPSGTTGWPGLRYSEAPDQSGIEAARAPGLRSTSAPATLFCFALFASSSLSFWYAIMRTLITGGAGFVGSHLCERFLAEGHDLLCVDNFITGSAANIEPLTKSARFRFIHHDISQPLTIDGPLDNILHFASPAS